MLMQSHLPLRTALRASSHVSAFLHLHNEMKCDTSLLAVTQVSLCVIWSGKRVISLMTSLNWLGQNPVTVRLKKHKRSSLCPEGLFFFLAGFSTISRRRLYCRAQFFCEYQSDGLSSSWSCWRKVLATDTQFWKIVRTLLRKMSLT